MPRLNYRHLEYFWQVAREGGVTAASRILHVGQPAISNQIRKLERALGEDLFDRTGKTMVLTEVGQVVYGYADEIFSMGRDLKDAVGGLPGRGPLRLTVGVVDSLPKLMAHRLVMPALAAFEHLRLELTSGLPDELFAALAVHSLDLVLSDSPLPTAVEVKAYNHFLGDCEVVLMGAPAVASRYREGLPGCLDGGPILMPGFHSSLPKRSSSFRCSRRAMNSSSALVTAAFFVFSPLTSNAFSSNSGSMDRFVAMCQPPHIILHISLFVSNLQAPLAVAVLSLVIMIRGGGGE